MNYQKTYATSDLDEISSLANSFITKFSNSEILIAGVTGFVGSWILSSIQHMNRFYGANINVTGVSRNINNEILSLYPETKFVAADISKNSFEIDIKQDCIFNAATPSTPAHGGEHPNQIMDATIDGTRNLIRLASSAAKPIFINLSSGIVSKRQGDQHLDLDIAKDAYLEAKRTSEKLVNEATVDGNITGSNLRLYAFAGPGISLVDHFAIGNFLNDALNREPIRINGNPLTRRSYLYPTDLLANIFAAASSSSVENIEIGSTSTITMFDLANLINRVSKNEGINQAIQYSDIDEYHPAHSNLLVEQKVSLEEGITRWMTWLDIN